MPKSMRSALGNSLRAEEEAVKTRFERAENILARTDFSAPGSGDNDSAPDTQQAATHTPLVPPTLQARQEEGERVKRDSFTMPVIDHELIANLQKRCMKSAISPTKSEILRAGLAALCAMDDSELAVLVEALPKVKTGRKPGHTV